jgi:predicted O-linked N-acetylglucosamine transferase (SPINDLY family)
MAPDMPIADTPAVPEIGWFGGSLEPAPTLAGVRLESLLPLIEQAGQRHAAIAAYKAWINANSDTPQLFAAWFNLGVELARDGQFADAESAYRQALALQPKLDQASVNLGLVLEAQGQADAALAIWDQALQPMAMRTALLNHRGRLLEDARRFAEAERALHASLLLDPRQPDVVQHWLHLRQKACIWPLYDNDIPGLTAADVAMQSGPLGVLALTDDIGLQRRSVSAWLERKVPPAPIRMSPPQGYRHDRIRLGYLSSDFCRHALSFLMVETLERHDRRDFEVFGYCSSPDDGSDIRRRVIAAMDHHIPIGHLDDRAAAERIRADEIDILVDLNGLTKGARLHSLRHKPAPVQVTYLGYIGCLPLPELDYVLCDDTVIPPTLAAQYAPHPLSLGGLYQANDSRMPELPEVSRRAEGLPENRFVFCCFSHHYKITEAMFAAWMTILRRLDHAVLWLVDDTAASRDNLLRHATAQGVAAERLIFAARTDPARYMARFALADLFLDTSPYNAGTVASDALRMGLPLVTLSGRAFASRMAGSLLRAIGLHDGITVDLDTYIDRATAFGSDPALHARARAILAGDAWRGSIGDSVGFTRNLEAALRAIRLQP